MTGKEYRLSRSINLVGTGCPMNLVYLKVELAKMSSGQVLQVVLDDGAPVRNVTKSIEGEGHELLKKEQLGDGSWTVIVRKG